MGVIKIHYNLLDVKSTIKVKLGSALKFIKKHPSYTIADKQVANLYPDYILPNTYIISANEKNKSFLAAEKFVKWLSLNGCTRKDSITALGGGVTSDMAGFAASVYMRGIDVNIIPTTLLSMVDSAIGGKTAVNAGGIKNLAGAFHQPKNVIIDPLFLDTLNQKDYLSGLGEVIKTAAIADTKLFEMLAKEHTKVMARDKDIMEEVISRVCGIKAALVNEDPLDRGRRVLLNAGHTIAHAIESDSKYKIPHGHAVAIGLHMETKAGERLGYTEKGTAAQLAELLTLYGYPLFYTPVST
jgi:3-dehydroquinate synthase